VTKRGGEYFSCAGAIAVVAHSTDDFEIIDETFQINRKSTNNNGEIKAINLGIRLGVKYKMRFSNIYLFSDSKLSIYGLREWIERWVENSPGCDLIGTTNAPVSNQQDILSCIYDIMVNQLRIGLYHQKGHCEISGGSLGKAFETFKKNNNIKKYIDKEFIKFICNMNCYVDQKSRYVLLHSIQAFRSQPVKNTGETPFYVYRPFNVKYYLSLVRN
jgi:ribonuclease HI